jgi:hypothetical protein
MTIEFLVRPRFALPIRRAYNPHREGRQRDRGCRQKGSRFKASDEHSGGWFSHRCYGSGIGLGRARFATARDLPPGRVNAEGAI